MYNYSNWYNMLLFFIISTQIGKNEEFWIVCLNSTWKEEQLKPNYSQPFGIISEKKKICNAEEAVFSTEKGIFDGWLPKLDSNQRPND